MYADTDFCVLSMICFCSGRWWSHWRDNLLVLVILRSSDNRTRIKWLKYTFYQSNWRREARREGTTEKGENDEWGRRIQSTEALGDFFFLSNQFENNRKMLFPPKIIEYN